MYKVSRFSYWTRNARGELLLYNSYVGERSLCKISKEKNIALLMQLHELEALPQDLLEKLAGYGILVSDKLDEDKKLISQRYSLACPSDLHLTINPTESCNFACKYCYEKHLVNEMSLETRKNIISFVAANISKYTGLHVSWFGGEPLLKSNIVVSLSEDLIKICKFYKKKYSADMTTNGYLLNIEMFKTLLANKVYAFQVTLDGTRDMHDSKRVLHNGKGTYDTIIDNLIQITQLKRKDFRIVIRTNFNREMMTGFDAYYDILEKYFDDKRFYISFYTIKNVDSTVEKNLVPTILDNNANPMRFVYEKILKRDKILQIRSDFLNPGMGLCYGGKKNNYVIRSDGKIYKCTIDFEKEENSVAVIENNALCLYDNYYDYISDASKCEKYMKCFYAPVCTGDPCPLKKFGDNKCSFVMKNIDLVLQIIDRYHEFEIIDV